MLGLRGGAGDDRAVAQQLPQLAIVEGGDVTAGAHRRPGGQPGLLGHRGRGRRMITGDHDRGHPGCGQGGNRVRHTDAQRVGERGQPDEPQLRLGLLALAWRRGKVAFGECDHPQSAAGQLRELRVDPGSLVGIEHTTLQHRLRGARGRHPHPIAHTPGAGEQFAGGIEREPGQGLAALKDPGLAGRGGQRAVHRFPAGPVHRLGVQRGVQHGRTSDHLAESQLVLGQGAGLVGDQGGDHPQGLSGAQPPQQRPAPGQLPAPDREQHHHQDRQLLGHRGERHGQPGQQHLPPRLPGQHPDPEHHRARGHREHQHRAGELAKRLLQRRRRLAAC